MPLQATSGAASYDAFGGGVPAVPNYIEDVFSCFLYSGTNAAQTITNNIDLSTYGGVVWQKARISAIKHRLFSTNMTLGRSLSSNSIFAEDTAVNITSYSTTGFTVAAPISDTGENYVTWTFRKQPKFFDVQTWTGSGVNRTIAHNLGSVPGCIIVKCIDDDFAWAVYHRSLANTQYLVLNSTAAAATGATWWNSTTPTSAVFSLGTDSTVNALNKSYIAYIYAHDAGGFGLTGTDNVISCGSFNSTALNNLGWEPQFVMMKRTDSTSGWFMFDNMRGLTAKTGFTNPSQYLYANTSDAETEITGAIGLDPLGFSSGQSGTYIYIAIRRGPMKVPTSGTSVFSPVAYSGTGATRTITAGFPVDLAIPKSRGATGNSAEWYTRLIGPGVALLSAYTFQELARPTELTSFASNTGVVLGTSSDSGGTNASGSTYVDWNFRRAPSFFDEVCYTGNGSSPGQTLNHNLNAVPELIIWKARSNGVNNWYVYNATVGTEFYVELNTTIAKLAFSLTGSRTPTSTVFHTCTGGDSSNNGNNITYVAYLFATCAGVSKVGSYTGTGAAQTINCGFTSGARFVLIKRTDSTGSWYVWDSSRGIVSGNDPYLLLNSTAAEVTNTDYIDTYSAGFEISSTAPSEINASGGTFIFLAIA